jgi:hypothetical protein
LFGRVDLQPARRLRVLFVDAQPTRLQLLKLVREARLFLFAPGDDLFDGRHLFLVFR